MVNPVHERIRVLIEKNGLTPEAAAKECGLDRGYFQKLFSREHASPKGETLSRIAHALGSTEQWILTGESSGAVAMLAHVGPIKDAPTAVLARRELPTDVPVMGTAAGSHLRGAFQFEGGVIDYVRRPPALMETRDVYALFVEGSSMEPQFAPGDLIYIHPHKPPRFGDAVVVQTVNGVESPEQATLGIYIRRTEKHVVIGKHNPKSDIALARETVKAIHKVLTLNELFGV